MADARAAAVQRAFAEILRRTQQHPRTREELRRALARRHDDDVVAEALTRACTTGVVDDVAFARAWVDDRGQRRGYGVARLRQELRRRLVPEELVEEALAVLETRDDLAAATDLARKRAAAFPPTLEPPVVARRLAGFLARRGYGPALAEKVAIRVSGLDRYASWD